jgi:hypothetical protein
MRGLPLNTTIFMTFLLQDRGFDHNKKIYSRSIIAESFAELSPTVSCALGKFLVKIKLRCAKFSTLYVSLKLSKAKRPLSRPSFTPSPACCDDRAPRKTFKINPPNFLPFVGR